MKLLASVNPWFGDGSIHRMTRYKSNNPATITRQLNCMQATVVNGMRIAGVLLTWQGPLAAFQHSTAIEMSAQCTQRGMLFGLLLDPWCYKLGTGTPTQNVIAALNNPSTQVMLNSPSYLPEKYICDFADPGKGADPVVMAKTFPSYKFLTKTTGFSWIAINMSLTDSATRNAAAVADLKQQNSSPAMKIPGICLGFNDAGMPMPRGVTLPKWTGTRDFNEDVWGDAPARVLDTQAGGLFFDQMGITPLTAPYLQLITWNDYDERTAIEDVCSMLSGIPIY